MKLTLTVISDQKYSLPEHAKVKVIGQQKATIGREDCDWVLPDRNAILSRKHCCIEYKSGDFYITDVSRHGVSINHQPIEKNTPIRLVDGVVLALGDYEIEGKLDTAVEGEDSTDHLDNDWWVKYLQGLSKNKGPVDTPPPQPDGEESLPHPINADESAAFDAFLKGAGLQNLKIPPEQVAHVMANLGAMFRETVQGLRARVMKKAQASFLS